MMNQAIELAVQTGACRTDRLTARAHRLSTWTIAAGYFLGMVVITSMAGCTLGPDYQRPSAPDVIRYTPEPLASKPAAAPADSEAPYFIQERDIPGQWWTLFQSRALNTLVEQAMQANPDVRTAQAALRVAQENVYAQQGAYSPSVTADFSSSRQKNAGSIASPASSGATIFSLHTAQVNVSYVPDVFGGNRRQVESLLAQTESQRFQLEAVYLTLTSNVVVAAIQEASLRGQITATQKMIELETEQLGLIRRQSEFGAVPEANAVAQEAALAQTQAALPLLQKQLAQQRNLLAALAGRFPSQGLSEMFDLASLKLPRELPLSLPSKLVEQRPDIRSAEAQLHAASAQIGVAVANRLPQFTLTANDGSTATRIGDLVTSSNGFWGVAAGVTQSVFQGGTLLHRKRAAEAAYDQAAAQYRSTVITACQNVADTLRALQADAGIYEAAQAAERATARSLEIARRQLQIGDISYLAQLNAEQAYQQAAINLIQAQTNRYTDTAALFQALGGGWWNRAKVTDVLRSATHSSP